MKELIHFAHGNGFPALCYKQFLDRLSPQFDCVYIDKIGHDSRYPVSDNWDNLVTELIESITTQAHQPVIAIGHSLGGVLSLLAAIAQPHLFKAVLLLDSPLIGPFKSNIVRIAKALGVIDRITPAFRSKGRRTYWQDKEQLQQYLKTRDLFKAFSDECLNDYITYGLEHKGDGYHLRFDRHIEYQIYRTIPHTIPKIQHKLLMPASLIYGNNSTVVGRIDRLYMDKQFGIKNYKISGGHLFPLEDPKAAAERILYVIDKLMH